MIDAFANWLAAAGRTPSTIALYRERLVRLERETGIGLTDQTPESLAAWIATHDWARATKNGHRATLLAFYKFATMAGLVASNPAESLPPAPAPPPCPRPIPEDVLDRALAAADDRQRLALLLGSRCGLRLSETAAVNVADLEPDLFGHSLRVRGKGAKTRLVPVADGLAEEIRDRAGEAGFCFPSRIRDRPHISGPRLARLVAGLLEGHTFHSLRHRFATVAYAQTGDLLAVSRALGHASPTTTELYIQTDARRLRAVVLAAA